jgi:hypothetical protein
MDRVERFWSRVDRASTPDGCWPRLGSRDKDGYGFASWRGRTVLAHRQAYELAVGPIPDGMLVCHSCDNPPCCRPGHLFLGSNVDNQRDMTAKGRGRLGDRNGSRVHPERLRRGEQHGCSKLTAEKVRQIRELYAGGGLTQRQVGDRYGVSNVMVGLIVSRKKWAHVT